MSIFERLLIREWRQFGSVSIAFHPRLTILTGANGAGKTTILHILNRHWGWKIPYVSAPASDSRARRHYWAGFWGDPSSADSSPPQDKYEIGGLEYGAHSSASLSVPRNVSETFAVMIDPMPALAGVYVPSHRPLYVHQTVQEIPTTVDAREQLFEVYLNEIRNRWTPKARVTSASYLLKRSLISLATYAYPSETIVPIEMARTTFEGFQDILSIVLPREIGFQRLRIKVPDVLFETNTGTFSIDAVSGGISALLDIAWQVYLYSTLESHFVVVIDEPEAHLHPALQRAVMPSLLRAFPTAQFVVATHNPLVVGSSEDSAVYVLRHDATRRVHALLLDQVNKAGTANELLRDVLGVESTSALWVEESLDEILARYKGRELTRDTLEALRAELQRFGLAKFLPRAIDELKQ